MTQEEATTVAAQAAVARGFAWLACGWALWRQHAQPWLAMAALYFALALALKRLPFLGHFLLIFFSPVALAGALLTARALRRGEPLPALALPQPRHGLRRLLHLLRQAAHTLFQLPMAELERALTLVIVCIVTLGLAVTVAISELMLTGGSVISGLPAAPLAASGLRPTLVLALLAVVVLYALLAMALLYLVPLTLFGGRLAIPAMVESLRTCSAHVAAVAAFLAPYLVLLVLIAAVFGVWPLLGYALLFTLGLVALPAFVAGLYCSYEALFEPATTPTAGVHPDDPTPSSSA